MDVKEIKYRRVKTPVMIQMEAAECGAVALGIILGYFGKYVSIEDLRITCGVSRDGSNAYNIVQAAQKYGLSAHGYSKDTEQIYRMNVPFIIFWKFEHFLVVEGFDNKQVFLNDPALGPYSITHDEFERGFTGVVIELAPLATFQKSGTAPSLSRELLSLLSQNISAFVFVMLIGLCLVIPNLAFPAFAQLFIDKIMLPHDYTWMMTIIFCIALALVGKVFLPFLQRFALNRLDIALSLSLASKAFWHMLRLPLSYYLQRYPGEIATRLAITNAISNTITSDLATTAINLFFFLIYGIVLYFYDPLIGVTAIAIALVNLILLRRKHSKRNISYNAYKVEVSKSISFTLGALENYETIKASGKEITFFASWVGYYTRLINNIQDAANTEITFSTLSTFLSYLASITILAISGFRYMDGYLSLGMLIAIQMILRSFLAPIKILADSNLAIQLLKANIDRLNDIVKHPIDPLFNISQNLIPSKQKLHGFLELQGITFGHTPIASPILKNISFKLSPGKSIALVGPTGCGKSTIVKIIGGLAHPWEGSVLFDEHPRAEWNHQQIINSLALVEQEPFLFKGSFRENLTLLDLGVDQESILQATKDACLHDEILQRACGYDMDILENGSNLSEGQKQRLEIARGLIKNPKIVVLDEATSALDADMEDAIIRNIRRRGCALLIVAHRHSTIRNCDEIIVIDNGSVVASGTYEQLQSSSGLFRDLFEND